MPIETVSLPQGVLTTYHSVMQLQSHTLRRNALDTAHDKQRTNNLFPSDQGNHSVTVERMLDCEAAPLQHDTRR